VSADIEIAPIPSDGKPGSIWPGAFEARRNKTTGDVVVRCQPGYRSNETQPKRLANGRVRLRVVGDSRHQTRVYVIRELAGRHSGRGTRAQARRAAVADVLLIKIGSTQGPIGNRIGPQTMHPDECVVLAVLPGLDKKDHHPRWASFQLRRIGPGCEFFEWVGALRQYVESLPRWEGEPDEVPDPSGARYHDTLLHGRHDG
jgi:hypothetical protein